jgi:hypothetical protein
MLARLGTVLDELFDVVHAMRAQEETRRKKLIIAGVGFVTLALTAEYLQLLPTST